MTEGRLDWIYGGDDIEDGLADWHAQVLEELVGGVSRQEMPNGTLQLRVGSESVGGCSRASA